MAAARQCEQWLRASRIPARHDRFHRWEELNGPEPYLRAVGKVRRFTEHGDSVLIVVGTRGSGKTQALAVAVRQTIVAGRPARYTTALELLADLKRRYADGGAAELAWLAEWCAPWLLAIDEVAERADSDHSRLSLTTLVDKRYSMNLPTILSGNVETSGLAACLGASVCDRANEGGGVVSFADWPSFRRATDKAGPLGT